jgi:hypothetical protein
MKTPKRHPASLLTFAFGRTPDFPHLLDHTLDAIPAVQAEDSSHRHQDLEIRPLSSTTFVKTPDIPGLPAHQNDHNINNNVFFNYYTVINAK